jgi:E3 ubiquitin-protein ligase HECTD2
MSPSSVRRSSRAVPEAGLSRPHAAAPETLQPLPELQFDYRDDSSSSDSELHPHRPRKSPARIQHSRSMSNPFPSFFSPLRKTRAGSSEQQPSSSDSDVSGDVGPRAKAGQRLCRGTSLRGAHNRRLSKDFTAGNCMTCGSRMRWPKELKTFRCTICLTLNDLVPIPIGDDRGRHAATRRARGASPQTGRSSSCDAHPSGM